jgi:hypothetical protein
VSEVGCEHSRHATAKPNPTKRWNAEKTLDGKFERATERARYRTGIDLIEKCGIIKNDLNNPLNVGP